MTNAEQAANAPQGTPGTHEPPPPINTPGNDAEPNLERVDYETLADQVQALTGSMDNVSETGRAFLAGAQTALRATAEAMHVD